MEFKNLGEAKLSVARDKNSYDNSEVSFLYSDSEFGDIDSENLAGDVSTLSWSGTYSDSCE